MRTTVAYVLVIGLAACSSGVPVEPPIGAAPDAGGGPPVGSTDAPTTTPPPPPPIDAGVEIPIDATVGGPLVPPTRGFQIIGPTIDIDPHADITWCFYFETKNIDQLAIQSWESRMTPGAHDMIVYLTSSNLKTPGTLANSGCGFAGGIAHQRWTYAAQTDAATGTLPTSAAFATATLPADDGTGTPVAQLVKGKQAGFIQMHFVNPSDAAIQAHVELNGYAYGAGVAVTAAAPFVTYNTMISLLPGSAVAPKPGFVEGSCAVAAGAKFFQMTTHTHKQGVHALVQDALLPDADPSAPKVFESLSWERPGEQTWTAAPFLSFASGKLSYRCEYMNPTTSQIFDGDRPAADETCMAVGFFFPAVNGEGHLCIDNNLFY